MSRLDYSKWDNIEISDDDDDTHPNVDTASLFKWRHEARIQRKEEEEKEKNRKAAERKSREQMITKLKERRDKLQGQDGDAASAQLKGIEQRLQELEVEQTKFMQKEAELERMQREHPKWDVDNISKDKHSRTVINGYSSTPAAESSASDTASKDVIDNMQEFFVKNREECIGYAHSKTFPEAQKFLAEHPNLLCDHLASFLVIYCVDCQVDNDDALVKRVATNTVVIQYILELAKSMKRDARDCFNAFFARMAAATDTNEEYKAMFNDEVASLIERVRDRAQARYDEAVRKAEEEAEEARNARLGPGGLDPFEVLESLPADIKAAFEKQDTPALQAAFGALSPEDAKYHFQRVVDSGLWVPAGGDGGEDGQANESTLLGSTVGGLEKATDAELDEVATDGDSGLDLWTTATSYCSVL